MTAFLSILILFLFLGAGSIAAQFSIVRNNRVTERLSSWVLYALLFFMGFRIASSTGIDSLAEIGSLSLAFTFSTVLGTALVLLVIYLAASILSGGADFAISASASAEDPREIFAQRS